MDWRKSIKELCDPNVEVVKRRLRRIHLRWYHASTEQMVRLLQMIGCPETAIELVPDIVGTCRVCRTWARKAPDTKLAVRLSIKFNQCVQVDLLFYECAATPLGQPAGPSVPAGPIRAPTDHIVLHLVDECIRWSVAVCIRSKTPEDTIEGIVMHWLKIFGAPEMMIWDGERAMVSAEALNWASRNSIQLIARPKTQEGMGCRTTQRNIAVSMP